MHNFMEQLYTSPACHPARSRRIHAVCGLKRLRFALLAMTVALRRSVRTHRVFEQPVNAIMESARTIEILERQHAAIDGLRASRRSQEWGRSKKNQPRAVGFFEWWRSPEPNPRPTSEVNSNAFGPLDMPWRIWPFRAGQWSPVHDRIWRGF